MQLKNNTILITGGSGGIGLELAVQLKRLGNNVIITGRNSQKLERVKKDFPEIHVIMSDVTQIAEIESLFTSVTRDFPHLNFLINNAGIGQTLDVLEQHEPSLLVRELDTNLTAPIQMINRFLPHLVKQENAAIMNVTSALAFTPLPLVPIYSASKAGLHSYTLSLRAQLRNTSVKVFELAPPTTQTDMLHGFGSGNLKGVPMMKASNVVSQAIRALGENQFEICPGQAKTLRLMSRLAPGYTLRLMEKSLRSRMKARDKK